VFAARAGFPKCMSFALGVVARARKQGAGAGFICADELADQELLIASHLVPSVSNNHPPQPEERAIASAVPHERRSGSVFPPSVELDAETYLRPREINLSDQSAVLDNVPVQSRLAPRCESQLPQAFHSTSPFP